VDKLVVRECTLEDCQMLLQMNLDNKEYFEKWMPVKPDVSYYSLQGQLEKIKSIQQKSENDESYSYGIFLEDNNTLIGNVSFAFVHRGPHQSCMIGYQLAEKYTGKGYATKAIGLSLEIVFKKLNFHRIIAEVHPDNIGSIRVLEKAGFTREGYARKNLKIDGEWLDHICMAILSEDKY
jgi:[ribosomal protein S5]-alanine N-acetyltransferase